MDARRIEDNILDGNFKEDDSFVLRKLDEEISRIEKSAQPEINFKSGEKILKDWLHEFSLRDTSQEKLTNYLRCELAHLSFDYIESDKETEELDDLIEHALVFLKNRDLERSFFPGNDKDKEALCLSFSGAPQKENFQEKRK
ncbi:hypothetical protein [Leptospira alexanderi]|uniref:Uncharacterized protein n=1 Tax=Leptospira alexanderi serovar Manhao 3 str. L 60 TaxID=1049759 RepID=V6HU84_9LEPT|nr:hypothetical protein [Leptospira alexanderi]EQA61275.1 hypothetical protein LEP1GSC062_1277 [Leptospira alexanderi serovar Manhao 3 str. L 60]